MSYAYQMVLEYLADDLQAIHGPDAIDTLMARPRDPVVTTLCEFAAFVAKWDDSRNEREDDITIRALNLGITLTQSELELLLALYTTTKD